MRPPMGRYVVQAVLLSALATLVMTRAQAQIDSNERAFPQPKATVEKTLKTMQSALAGRLPALEGFANAEHPLDRYQRGYYQASVQVISAAGGGSLVRISVKVTAWYADPVVNHSGYQLLTSNGRLEADLLDQLAEQLAKTTGEAERKVAATSTSLAAPPPTEVAPPATEVAPPPTEKPATSNAEASNGKFSSALQQSLAEQERELARAPKESRPDKAESQLRAEADSLAEILKNQAHPKNLVAVRKSGTPVVGTPSLEAKQLFLASMHDEFEMLDFNEDWVHVRISGLSRGWIWRNSLEMPEGIPDTARSGSSPSVAADLFHVIREETAPFPGDWPPLRGKSVKIISVQKVDDNAKESGPRDKLEFAKYLLDKSYGEMRQQSQQLAGIVLIFDSADGGMIAATVASLQQWKAGTMSDAALWHKCFFDPPETFNSAGSSGTQ
jgi:hypothetical protein